MSYPGSKAQSGVAERIIGQMPPHTIYFETHFGSGQVFHRKRPAALNIICDVDAGVFGADGASPGVWAIHGDATSWLNRFRVGSRALLHLSGRSTLPRETVVYSDPPYPLATRTEKVRYRSEMTNGDHAALLSALLQLRCYVLISTYPNELYATRLLGWRCLSYTVRTRGRTLTELLYCNFDEPGELHDWRFAGNNFRQRTAFKRVATRWLGKLRRMSPRKRGYVLDALNSQAWPLAPETMLRAGDRAAS